jgi:hypothetical protein
MDPSVIRYTCDFVLISKHSQLPVTSQPPHNIAYAPQPSEIMIVVGFASRSY